MLLCKLVTEDDLVGLGNVLVDEEEEKVVPVVSPQPGLQRAPGHGVGEVLHGRGQVLVGRPDDEQGGLFGGGLVEGWQVVTVWLLEFWMIVL